MRDLTLMIARTTLLAVAAMGLISGCADETGPKRVPVTGVVTYNGKPLEGAVVTFSPQSVTDANPRPGESLTDASGKFALRYDNRDGVTPGKYIVVITKSLIDPSLYPAEFKDDPAMAQIVIDADSAAKRGSKPKAPTKIELFFDRDVVPEGGEFQFEVGSTPSPKTL